MKKSLEYINLLPKEEKKSAVRFGIGLLLPMVFIMGWAGLFGWQIKLSMDQKARLEALELKRQALLQELAAIHKELGIDTPAGANPERAALIHSLLGERVLWSEVFRQFSRIVPKGLWFDNLEGSSGERAEIKIRGGAFNYLSIAEFMLAMEKSGFFESPQLIFAQKNIVSGLDVVGFEIHCGIKKGQVTK